MNKDYDKDFELTELYEVLREIYPKLKERENLYDKVKNIVYNYPKENEMGFTQGEIDILLKETYPNINMNKFNNALNGITCYVHPKTKQILTYDIDIVRAIVCGIENSELTVAEWD